MEPIGWATLALAAVALGAFVATVLRLRRVAPDFASPDAPPAAPSDAPATPADREGGA